MKDCEHPICNKCDMCWLLRQIRGQERQGEIDDEYIARAYTIVSINNCYIFILLEAYLKILKDKLIEESYIKKTLTNFYNSY